MRLVKVEEILPGAWEELVQHQGTKVVKFFFFKVNTIKFIFLNKLCLMVYYIDSLITMMNMIYYISYAGVIWCSCL